MKLFQYYISIPTRKGNNKMTTNKAYKMIKNTLAAYPFLSLEDVVKQANKTNPEAFEAIAKAEIKITQEAMGL